MTGMRTLIVELVALVICSVELPGDAWCVSGVLRPWWVDVVCRSTNALITQTCPTYANFNINNAHIQDEDQTRDNPGLHPLLQRYLSDVVCVCTVSCHLVE